MIGWLRDRLRKAQRARGPLVQCPHDGEIFWAPGYFDLTHDETIDGVACGRTATLLSDQDIERIRVERGLPPKGAAS